MAEEKFMRQVRSFVLREGRMTKAQENALASHWPTYGLLVKDAYINPSEIFGRQGKLILEIGFGMGHSLVEMAKANPDNNYIGIEVHRPGVGALLSSMEKEAVKNIRVFQADAVEVLKNCIPDNTLDEVLLFFPDPWPKKKHHKRRIVQPSFVQLVRKKLKNSGLFHMATDWENYAQHMLDLLESVQGFVNINGAGQFASRPSHRPLTKFELRGQRLGHGVWDLMYQKEE